MKIKRYLKEWYCFLFHPRELVMLDSPWWIERCPICGTEETFCCGYD